MYYVLQVGYIFPHDTYHNEVVSNGNWDYGVIEQEAKRVTRGGGHPVGYTRTLPDLRNISVRLVIPWWDDKRLETVLRQSEIAKHRIRHVPMCCAMGSRQFAPQMKGSKKSLTTPIWLLFVADSYLGVKRRYRRRGTSPPAVWGWRTGRWHQSLLMMQSVIATFRLHGLWVDRVSGGKGISLQRYYVLGGLGRWWAPILRPINRSAGK